VSTRSARFSPSAWSSMSSFNFIAIIGRRSSVRNWVLLGVPESPDALDIDLFFLRQANHQIKNTTTRAATAENPMIATKRPVSIAPAPGDRGGAGGVGGGGGGGDGYDIVFFTTKTKPIETYSPAPSVSHNERGREPLSVSRFSLTKFATFLCSSACCSRFARTNLFRLVCIRFLTGFPGHSARAFSTGRDTLKRNDMRSSVPAPKR